MEKAKISKILDGIVARSTFNRLKGGENTSFKDRLFLDIVESEGSVAYQFLLEKMQDWQVFQLKLRVKQLIEAAPKPERLTSDEFHREFLLSLVETFAPEQITTLHALMAIAEDKSTALAAVLNMYGVSTVELRGELLRFALLNGDMNINIKRLDVATRNAPTPTKSKAHALDKFGRNLTEMARKGEIDPVIGRDKELEQTIEILSRRKKNNPILVGEAGVGKSAVVEALALRIASGEVPYNIANRELYLLDISSLVAGTKFRGEFEERMNQLIEALSSSSNTILFIDEIHTIVGAGATQGSLDIANILKPALARGELQVIGATTLNEYRDSIESDSALERRFQRVVVEPTSVEVTIEIMRRIAPLYQKHHNVVYTDEAIEACVRLSDRYINDRHLPDKAIDVMDQVGARAHILRSKPAQEVREVEMAIEVAGKQNERCATWHREVEQSPTSIDTEAVESTIATIAGIPAEHISKGERERLKGLAEHLKGRVIGQERAIEQLTQAIFRARAGIRAVDRPIGVFMFAGPTGVGKTLLAKELAKWLFDDSRALIRLDMSEYSEKHNIARLIGSPPGYVGYGQGGELSEAVRRRPYSVVLLDEVEKAHPEVFNTMLQIFDEGHLTDGSGRKIDFRNTIIIMTSNVGSRRATKVRMQVGYSNNPAQARTTTAREDEFQKAIEQRFAPEFLNRIDDILHFKSLTSSNIMKIVEIELLKLKNRLLQLGYNFRITPNAYQALCKLGYSTEYGARALRRTISEHVENPLSRLIIDGQVNNGDTIVVEKKSSTSFVRLRVA